MAGVGLYGTYYSKCVLTNGILTGFSGVENMGNAIEAHYTPTDSNTNSLWANNKLQETDTQAGAGGSLELTLDRLTYDAQAEIFGLTKSTASVTVGGETVTGTGFDETGAETPNPVGTAFIRLHQEDNSRAIHEVVIYSFVTFSPPEEDGQTIGEDGVTWQTPTLTGDIGGPSVCGTFPWRKKYRFPSQAAAEAFITAYFAAS